METETGSALPRGLKTRITTKTARSAKRFRYIPHIENSGRGASVGGRRIVRILVTGGAGYVGSVSVERLVEAGHDVIVLDDLSTGHRAAAGEARLVAPATPMDPSTGPCSTGSGSRRSSTAPRDRSWPSPSPIRPSYYRENVAGGVALLEAARTAESGGSCSRRAPRSTASRTRRRSTRTPGSSRSTRTARRSGPSRPPWLVRRAYGLRSVSLRYFNVAGASERNGERHAPETHLVPNVLLAVEAGRPLTIFGTDYPTADGTNVRDYIHVEDLADAHLAALEATAPATPGPTIPSARRRRSRAGGGHQPRQRDRVQRPRRDRGGRARGGPPIPSTAGPRRPGDPPVLVAANDRARTVLGWTPRRGSLDEMIGSAWAWRRDHPAGYADPD